MVVKSKYLYLDIVLTPTLSLQALSGEGPNYGSQYNLEKLADWEWSSSIFKIARVLTLLQGLKCGVAKHMSKSNRQKMLINRKKMFCLPATAPNYALYLESDFYMCTP